MKGKMMKLPSVFKSKDSKKLWEWPSCNHPKTLSFRVGDDIYKTVNSIFFDPLPRDGVVEIETPDQSWFTNSSESTASASNSTESDPQEMDGQSLEMIVRGAKSERLFFEPDDTNSILEKSKLGQRHQEGEELGGYKNSLMVSMESANPYEDFRRSMEEMVESHGVRDWDGLEELLGWYLKLNWTTNHGFIVGAFVDVLVDILVASSSSSSLSSSAEDSTYYSCSESPSASSSSSSSLHWKPK